MTSTMSVTVNLDDLRTVLQWAEHVADAESRGHYPPSYFVPDLLNAVDRIGDEVCKVTVKETIIKEAREKALRDWRETR